MTYRIFSLSFLLFATFAMATNANAEIITRFDASVELPEETENANDLSESVINTGAVTNGVYDTRSTEIGQDARPHLSGVVPNEGTANGDGLFYVNSAATNLLPSVNQADSAYQEFQITVNDSQLDLDTLSYNYWATEASINDQESDTNFSYETRALASVNSNEDASFSNLALASSNTGSTEVTISNPRLNNDPLATPRFDNVVQFDLSSLDNNGVPLTAGDVVRFRLAFSDFTLDADGTTRLAGPDDGLHIHRLDNVEIATATAVPEPSAICLLIGSFGLLGLRRRR